MTKNSPYFVSSTRVLAKKGEIPKTAQYLRNHLQDIGTYHICQRAMGKDEHGIEDMEHLRVGKVVFSYVLGEHYCPLCLKILPMEDYLDDRTGLWGTESHA